MENKEDFAPAGATRGFPIASGLFGAKIQKKQLTIYL
jgi:hypothetical protein